MSAFRQLEDHARAQRRRAAANLRFAITLARRARCRLDRPDLFGLALENLRADRAEWQASHRKFLRAVRAEAADVDGAACFRIAAE